MGSRSDAPTRSHVNVFLSFCVSSVFSVSRPPWCWTSRGVPASLTWRNPDKGPLDLFFFCNLDAMQPAHNTSTHSALNSSHASHRHIDAGQPHRHKLQTWRQSTSILNRYSACFANVKVSPTQAASQIIPIPPPDVSCLKSTLPSFYKLTAGLKRHVDVYP